VLSASSTYTVNASNSQGSGTPFAITIEVIASAPLNVVYSQNPAIYTRNTIITPNTVASSSGGTITSFSISQVPAGLSFNTTTGTLSGTPSSYFAQASFTVTAINTGGSTTVNLLITVNDIPPSNLVYPNSAETLVLGTPLSLVPGYNGGAITSWTLNTTFPASLIISSDGTISGTPNVITARATYRITATNSGGSTFFDLTLTVIDVPPGQINFASTDFSFTVGSVISGFTPPTVDAGGGTITSWTSSPTLPTGVVFLTDGTLSGTPSSASTRTKYTVTASNTGGSVTEDIYITIIDIPPGGLAYAVNPLTTYRNVAMSTNTLTSSGGTILSFFISPNLVAG
jgi:hypothetical protein